jgi:curved DNA-binding protein CbpA
LSDQEKPELALALVPDYYEFLQINPNAKLETIQRVYRFLAARYHPDNRLSGDLEKFLLLKRAYEVLSDPGRRAQYDSTFKKELPAGSLFEAVDFLDGIEGEINRRFAVLWVLYQQCRANIHSPHVSLLDLEAQIGVPREYLDFTIWYLRSKKYIKQEDNADLVLTCLGVDYIESNRSSSPLLNKRLHGSRANGVDAVPPPNGVPEASTGHTDQTRVHRD